MIFKLDGKQTSGDFQKIFNRGDREHQYSLIQNPEIEKTAFQEELDKAAEKTGKNLLHAYQLIGRAMVMGYCNFKGFNGVIYTLHRKDEDFTISTKTKDGQEWEINHIDSKQFFSYLMYML